MVTENTKLARLIGDVLRLSDEDVETDERWAGVAELRQLDPEEIFEIAAGLCADRLQAEVVGKLAVEAAGLLGRKEFLPALRDLRCWWDVDENLLEKSIRRCEAKEYEGSEERKSDESPAIRFRKP